MMQEQESVVRKLVDAKTAISTTHKSNYMKIRDDMISHRTHM